MVDGPADRSQSITDDFWKQGKKIALAFMALAIIIFINSIVMNVIFIVLVDQHLVERDTFNEYPLYKILYDAVTGGLLLALAGIFITGRGRVAAWLKMLQVGVNGRLVKEFAMGAALGTIVALGADLLITLTDMFLFGGKFFLMLEPYLLLKLVLYLLPQLVLYTGMIALIQCYFQRKMTKHYGALEGLIVAVLVYMLLMLFPYNLDRLAYPQFSAQFLLTGATLGYLYLVAKSPYVPISFIVAYNFVFQVYYCVIGLFPLDSGSFMGISPADAYCIDLLLAGLLTLAMIWRLSRDRFVPWPGGLQGLKASVENVLSRLTRE